MMAWERFVTGEPVAEIAVSKFLLSSWQRSARAGVAPNGRLAPIVAQGDGNQAFEFFGDCDDLQYPGFLTVFLTVLTVCLENFFYDINVVFDQLMIEWE